jgi:hypothetical protein
MAWTSNTYSWNSKAGYVRYYFYATVTENSQSEDNNTTTLTVSFYAKGAYDPQYEGHSTSYNIYVDGANIGGGSGPSSLGTSYQLIGSKQTTVTHNEGGTKQIQIGVRLNSSDGASYLPADGTATLSPKCTLTKINRGLMRVNTPDGWKTGKPYVNVNGSWKLGQAFVNNGGSWERGI